jgi:hypothetical protein
VHSLIFGYFLVKLIRIFNRAIFDTGGTTGTFFLDNVSGLFNKGYLKVPCFAL